MTRSVSSGLLWVAGLAVLPFVAFQLGVARFQQANCSAPDFDGECDLSLVHGMAWAIGTLLVYCLVTLVVAYTRASRGSRRRA